MDKIRYVDGTNMVLGRLASKIAKLALLGDRIILVNCEKVIKTGKPQQVINEYLDKIQNIRGRQKGPLWPKRPDTIVRRAIKQMLPFKRERGKKALRNVEVYIGLPHEYEKHKLEQFEEAKLPRTKKFITIGGIAEKAGPARWK